MLRGYVLSAVVVAALATPTSLNITLQDTRRGRSVSAIVCGDNQENADLVVFAHGGGLYPEDYEYVCSSPSRAPSTVVARLITPPTDSPMDLESMAYDMVFLASEIVVQSRVNESFPLHGQLKGNVVLAGHSMGAAAAILAGATPNPLVKGVAAFAPGFWMDAQTTLLTTLGCELDMVPLMLVAGEHDCANSLDAQARPIWHNVTMPKCGATGPRFLIDVKGATHCQWTVPVAGACTFDKPCSTPHVDRSEQQKMGMQLLEQLVAGTLSSFLKTASTSAWSYVTETSSAAELADLPSSCPCGGATEEAVMEV